MNEKCRSYERHFGYRSAIVGFQDRKAAHSHTYCYEKPEHDKARMDLEEEVEHGVEQRWLEVQKWAQVAQKEHAGQGE